MDITQVLIKQWIARVRIIQANKNGFMDETIAFIRDREFPAFSSLLLRIH